MKKIIFTLSIIIISLFININTHADEIDSHPLIYDIESFEIKDNKLVFKGWAFLFDYHNVGLNAKTNNSKYEYPIGVKKTNTIIEIIISDGTKSRSNNNISGSTIKYDNNRDSAIYQANCMRKSVSDGGACVETYEKATCNEEFTSSCRYDNIGFEISFPIENIEKEFGTDKELTFKIKVTNTDKKDSREKALSPSKESYKNESTNNNTIQYGNTTLNIYVKGISSTVKMIEDHARILNPDGSFKIDGDSKWKQHSSFDVVKTIMSSGNSRGINGLKMYELKYVFNNQEKRAYPSNTSNITGYAYASWVETEGNLTIELSKVEKKCEEKGKEIEGTCEYKDDIEINVCHEIKGLQKTITSESIDFKNYDIRNSEGCTSELTKIIEGTADISYNSISNPLIDKNTIYAGGGFTFTSQYLGAAKYNFVGLKYTIVDWFKEDNICKKVSISKRITKDMPEWNEAVEYMANQIRITGNATTKAHDSNNAKNPNSESQQKIVDTWQISNNYKTVKEDKKWYPDEELNYNYLFMLKKACINTQTAEVTYKEICDPNNEIEGINSEGESLYYIPLKWPDNTPFNVKVEVSANLIKGTNNPLYTYTCKVNTKQKLYNIEGDKISYKFVYRPISLSNPFPGRKDKIAEKYNHNWYWLVQPQNQITFDKYVTNGRTKTEPEYIVTLTPNEISRMKNYNKYHNYTDFYSNGSDGTNYSIGKNGRNNFLDAYNVKRASTLIYNELGKCIEGKCWNNATLNQEQDTE